MTSYLSQAKTGVIKGELGITEDTTDSAISCQEVELTIIDDKIK
ncbi:MAG: CreA family protein [Arsenophonus sp. NEOnobi-MAG3]